jgi:exodeoxyribonuclease VII small subunit
MSKEKHTIEQKISNLESIVQSLEKGDCTLDAALKQYELGVALVATAYYNLPPL